MKKKSQLHAPVEAISYLLEPSNIVEAVQMADPVAAVAEEPKKKAKKVEEPVAEVAVEPAVEPVAEVVEEAVVEPAAE
jgi:hypothetical protein